jgi:GNAT superfamily N-acetyltransferase
MGVMGYAVDPADVAGRLPGLPHDHAVFVAEVDGRVAGWVHVHVDHSIIADRRAQLGGLAVQPEAQGEGVATALLRTAERWADEHGCQHMHIRSGGGRLQAHEFYRSRGYEDVKEQRVLVKPLGTGRG